MSTFNNTTKKSASSCQRFDPNILRLYSFDARICFACFPQLPTAVPEFRYRKDPKTVSIRRIFPESSYEEALELANLENLRNRREAACKKLFLQAYSDTKHKLHQTIPEENGCTYPLRKCHKFLVPKIRIERFKNSFIISNSI